MSIRVLYTEDEPFLARVVSDGLEKSGYTVRLVSEGGLILDAYHEFKPDICILDIMLPTRDGYMLARELRKIQPDLPIIFLSAKSLTSDVVQGFRSGGNDYLKKPFSMDELLIRMESLLRKIIPSANDTPKSAFGNCLLDTVQQRLQTSIDEYPLSFKQSALLAMLLDKRNEVLERRDALEEIWGENTYYNTRSMDVFISHLRKLLKDEPGIRLINVRGIGFKLICP